MLDSIKRSILFLAILLIPACGGSDGSDGAVGPPGPAGSADAWSRIGNSGTAPGIDFLGTTDAEALVLKVGNTTALVIEPTVDTPNLTGGHIGNQISNGVSGAVIGGGGSSHLVTEHYGVIGGGSNNQAGDAAGTFSDRQYPTVAGGRANVASGLATFVGGGQQNVASGTESTVVGGANNVASGQHASISGGLGNSALGPSATVSGGSGNQALQDNATIGGGAVNRASAGSTVAGGIGNRADGQRSSIGGGDSNQATADSATVAGGFTNTATAGSSTVAGGYTNQATGMNSTVGGGIFNTSSGNNATIPGGFQNIAQGGSSYAAGANAQALHNGAFVWSDTSSMVPFASTSDNQFRVRASGGVWLFTNGATTTGTVLLPNDGAWSALSDRNAKQDFKAVNSKEILSKVESMPIHTWSYRAAPHRRHMGPTAQDFSVAFGLGEGDLTINTIDADGVALVAIKGLQEVLKEKQSTIDRLEARLAALEAKMAAIETSLCPK